jgi:hypothetical protein
MRTKRTSCPSHAHFLRAVSGESGQEEKAEFVGHVSDCPRCQAKLKLLNSLRREFETVDHGLEGIELSPQETRAFRKMARSRLRELKNGNRRTSTPHVFPHRACRIALAVSFLALLIIGYGAVRHFTRGDADRRGGGEPFRLISPIGRIDGVPSIFTWLPVKDVDTFDFKLIDQDLNTIYTSGTTQTFLLLDPGVRAKLAKGTIYLWSVKARSDSDDKLAYAEGTFVIK